jgi:hypothetical protein
MKCGALALCLCALAPVAAAEPGTDWPEDTRLQLHDQPDPDDPPMAEFAQATTFVLMRLGDDGNPRCEAWTTRPDGSDANHGHLVHDKLEVDYHSAGIRLDVCDTHALVRDLGSGSSGGDLDVDGERWFRDARACGAAIAKRTAVATDFSACLSAAAPSQKAIDATRARFVAILQRGGALTVRDGDACRAARVAVTAASSALSIDYPDRVRTLDFSLDGDKVVVTNDHTVAKGSDNGSFGCVCADDYALHVADAKVDTFGETLYLDAATCRAQVAIDARRRSWLSSTGE